MNGTYDVAIIGGGINGCGIARDAAGRGLSVYLCEQADLASGTSSAATKLIHGGLRYLEYLEFRLVREALMEREILWRMAPHIIWPLRFVLPYHEGLRPAWLLRLGLFLYDHLGGRELLPATSTLDLVSDAAGAPLKHGQYSVGFEYSDCWVDDARLVTLNARDAADRGATIRTRTKALAADRNADVWRLTTLDGRSGETETLRARILINAAGPWVANVLAVTRRSNAPASIRLVQGSHIVIPRLYAHDRCYIFQNIDKRIIFAIPYENDFTLIGTTERDYVGDPGDAKTTADEIDYLCRAANRYFSRAITPAEVVWTYSGVRPLYDDGATEAQAATRDYVLDLDEAGAPMLSIFGGKITTYRRLALHALDRLDRYLSAKARKRRDWSGKEPLPGGDFPVQGFEALVQGIVGDYPWLGAHQSRRLARAYGTRARVILDGASRWSSLGRDFGNGLTEAEVMYLMREEWAQEAADVIWRRSKLGLRFSSEQVAVLENFMEQHRERFLAR
ncbi:MAG: glycerol-3-phosphate dehydrogenase [Xanthobacteraceae bacterium]